MLLTFFAARNRGGASGAAVKDAGSDAAVPDDGSGAAVSNGGGSDSDLSGYCTDDLPEDRRFAVLATRRKAEELRQKQKVRKKAEQFMKTVSIAEALFESLPQLALQVRTGFYGEELDEWVFITTFSLSLFCILKAVLTFFLNRKEIWETFVDLQEERAEVEEEGNRAEEVEDDGIRYNFEHPLEEKRGGVVDEERPPAW